MSEAANLDWFREQNGWAGCLVVVPIFQLRVTDSEFTCCEDIDAADLRAAQAQGISAALGIGADYIEKGSSFFGATISVEERGEVKARMVVAIGSALLS